MQTIGNRILVPVDLIDVAAPALLTAQDLAKRLQAELVLVHVYTVPEYTYSGMTASTLVNWGSEVRNAATEALDNFAQAVGIARALLREGDPASEIVKTIEEEKPMLVVMGTHGRQGLQRLLLGSVAERVIRRSPVPVVTVRMEHPQTDDRTKAKAGA